MGGGGLILFQKSIIMLYSYSYTVEYRSKRRVLFRETCITSVIYHPTISSTSSTITSKPDIYLNIYCFLKTRIKSKCIACVWKTWHYIPIDDIVIVEEKENVERKSLFNWEQIYVTDLLNSSFSLRFYICVLCSLIANKIHLKILRNKIHNIFSVI